MKITNARVIVCSPGRNFVTLKIETDEGLTGIGDATLNGRELSVASYLTDHVIPTGRDQALVLLAEIDADDFAVVSAELLPDGLMAGYIP